MIEKLRSKLMENRDEKKAKVLQRFFKTGVGEYGEGDIFLGITVPRQREIAKEFFGLPFPKIEELLNSKIHEERMTGGLILVGKYANSKDKGEIVNFYLKNAKKFNNWDLVDLTAPRILGDFLINRKREVLYKLSKSKNLWERRIAIVSTYPLIKKNNFEEILEIAEELLEDKEELINKAIGWMMREVGKKEVVVLENFLNKNYNRMPRITLRYAIEKFPKEKQKHYLSLV